MQTQIYLSYQIQIQNQKSNMTLVEVEDIVIRDIMHVTDADERYHSDDEVDEPQAQPPIPF